MSDENAIPPVALKKLLLDLDFLSRIPPNHKYCFTTREYVPNDWYYGLFRRFLGEKQAINGISSMRDICNDATQQWDHYKNNSKFNDALLDGIVGARQGIKHCHDNYKTLQKDQLAMEIAIDIIRPLDSLIPEDRKTKEGIISKKVKPNIDTDESSLD